MEKEAEVEKKEKNVTPSDIVSRITVRISVRSIAHPSP